MSGGERGCDRLILIVLISGIPEEILVKHDIARNEEGTCAGVMQMVALHPLRVTHKDRPTGLWTELAL